MGFNSGFKGLSDEVWDWRDVDKQK